MDLFNLTKIIISLITAAIALIIGFRVYFLNKDDWLNRWFALFFASSSLGFLLYSIYHTILNNAQIIIPIMIISHLFFNFNSISLTMTVIVLERFTKVAMSFKYLGRILILFIIMSIGYFIWIPQLDSESYELGIVNTKTSLGLSIFVNAIRIALLIYVVCKYIIISQKIEGETKNRVNWFTRGVIIVIIGLLINLSANFLGSWLEIIIEVLALIVINVGSFFILKGFLI
ncbi:MAG: hypothetical protein EAX89_14685 [Candidatus Lokiarchaeota archaeon]|nr:hypothetical protein [Candidatus Lokiarchaeota archaeon]